MSVLLCGWADKNFGIGNQQATLWPWSEEKKNLEFQSFSWSAAISAQITAEPKSMLARHFFWNFFAWIFSTICKVKHIKNLRCCFSVYLINSIFQFLAKSGTPDIFLAKNSPCMANPNRKHVEYCPCIGNWTISGSYFDHFLIWVGHTGGVLCQENDLFTPFC